MQHLVHSDMYLRERLSTFKWSFMGDVLQFSPMQEPAVLPHLGCDEGYTGGCSTAVLLKLAAIFCALASSVGQAAARAFFIFTSSLVPRISCLHSAGTTCMRKAPLASVFVSTQGPSMCQITFAFVLQESKTSFRASGHFRT